jgi:hypothetical protein
MLWVLRYFIGVALTSVQIQATSDSTAALWLGNTHTSLIYNAMQGAAQLCLPPPHAAPLSPLQKFTSQCLLNERTRTLITQENNQKQAKW